MLDRLLAAPSVSSTDPRFDQGNIAVIHLLAEWLEALGFEARVLELPGRRDKANLIATLGSGPGGLVLSGHTDTVPYDESLWDVDPLRLTERDGRLFGLGATDMKGFFPIVIEAARALRAEDLREPLIVLATADEESSMDGARELVRLGLPHGRYAVIGEPTGLRPVRCHKGILMESVRVVGRSGHSSNPQLGANALEGMHRVLGELLALRRDWQARYRNPMFDVNVPTLNLAAIHGGDNPNRICGHCELSFDIRPLPGMEPEALRAEIDRRLQALAAECALRFERESLIGGVEPFDEAADSPLVRAAEELTGHTAGAVAFATEGPMLQQLGMQTVVLGPGSIDQAHQPDEHMQLAQVRPAVELYRALIERFCLREAPAGTLQSGLG
jgi:acetylornithine deacetylase